MDRTIIVPYRAEEKELSHTLYNAIQGLMLLYTPSEDLRKCVSDEMFIKPNQHAFFHVMHYLFRIFDAQEFKKRFFWPITDKRSESSFRNTTVEYLKHINEKYQLNWNNIKSYLVVMPGGMKFISFLIDFVNFIAQELVKQKEKQLNIDANKYRSQVTEANLHKMCAKNELFKAMASDFIDALENLNTKYDDKTEKLMQHLEKLSEDTGLSLDLLIDEKFLESFENKNNQLFKKCYSDRLKKVTEMDHLINELKEAMEKFYSKETGYKYDKQRICQQLKRIRDNFPIDELIEESFGHKVTDEGVNINTLISTFNAINETIQSELKVFNKKPCAGEFVYSRLLSLKKELQEMETQITNFNKILHENMKKSKIDLAVTPVRANSTDAKKRNLENNLLMKLVSTPPIKFEVPEGGGKSRLALVDSKSTNANDTTFKNFLAPPRSMAIRHTNRNQSLVEQTTSDLNITTNRSKIIDPMQLLRSSSKKDSSKYKISTAQLSLSNLGSKWKQHQSFLDDNNDDNLISSVTTPIEITPKSHLNPLEMNKSLQTFTKTATPTILNQSPFTPFSSNDRTRIARSQLQLDSSIISGSNSLNSISTNVGKKLSAVKKVQDASLNFANLSTSPSGRLEPLVKAEDLDIPKLKLNDVSLIEDNQGLINAIFEKTKILENSPAINIEINDENNPNSGNVRKENPPANKHEQEEEEEALFNITDSVLKDITL